MIRCKPLLGTYVEISVNETSAQYSERIANHAMDQAFEVIELVQKLMGFHNPDSELSSINARSHIETLEVHEWTFKVLSAAKEIHTLSAGLFDCAVGAKLIRAGLLPNHKNTQTIECGDLSNLILIKPNKVRSDMPIQLDLGGIAKGFAVDKGVETLKANGIESGSVNAGGDLRVFGNISKEIQVRSPTNPNELIPIGALEEGSIASTGLYYSKSRDDMNKLSYIVNPLNMEHVEFNGSYSILAPKCMYADALTKVFAISQNDSHPCFEHFSAQAIKITA